MIGPISKTGLKIIHNVYFQLKQRSNVGGMVIFSRVKRVGLCNISRFWILAVKPMLILNNDIGRNVHAGASLNITFSVILLL